MIDVVLNAANYESLCDFSIIPPEGKMFNETFLKNGGNIFCKTDYIDYLFNNIKHSKYSYNLITHHSDYPIDGERFLKKPNCIKKWFAINPTYKHPDLIAIPLGLKTHGGYYLEPQYMTEWFCSQIKRLKNKPKQFNVYCNWNITNVSRNGIIDVLQTNNIPHTHDYNQPFYTYIENLASHRFVLSPPGNGIDCHRTWESLYCGCIPIVLKNQIYDDWKDLPILQVNSYTDITLNILERFAEKEFNYEKLNINYWRYKIYER
jgi:hypothetical protein